MARELIGSTAALAAVPPECVWALLVDPGHRPAWDHDVTWAVLEGGLVRGGYATIKPKRGRQTAFRIAAVEAPRCFSLELTFGPLASLTSTWTIDRAPEGARIEQHVEIAGPLALLVRGMAQRIVRAMPASLERLAALAADGAADPPG